MLMQTRLALFSSMILISSMAYAKNDPNTLVDPSDVFHDCSIPKNPKLIKLINEALEAERKGDLSKAIQIGKHVIEIEPNNECELNVIAGLYGLLENFDEEIVWARRALAANPRHWKAYINLGNAQSHLNKKSEAEISYQSAQRLASASPLPVYSLGVLAESQHKAQEAIEFYQKSIELDPKFENGYFNLAAMYGNTKRFSEAKEILQTLLKLNPNSDDAKAMLFQIEQELRK